MTKQQMQTRFRDWLARWLQKTQRPEWVADTGPYDGEEMLCAYMAGYTHATSDATKALMESRPQAVAR